MIEVNQLTKRFDICTAVDGVSFAVEKGEILGFMGPNGAGKSTTMRMITGYLPPSSGTAVIGGRDIVQDGLSARKMIGYLPENAPVYREMTVRGFLDFVAEVRGFSGAGRRKAVSDAIEKCFLAEVGNQSIGTLSKGFKQRVCFAQSILHDPPYLILDEPTDGLDPNQKHEVRQMIRDMSAEKAVILSTHILDEVDAVCTRVIIIDGGKLVADDTPEGLRTRSKTHGAVSMVVSEALPEGLAEEIGRLSDVGACQLSDDPAGFRLRAFPRESGLPIAAQILSLASTRGARIQSIFVEQGRLDEVFRDITTRDAGISANDSV
jgi:ABC-2 type transport system ATP-binding protein